VKGGLLKEARAGKGFGVYEIISVSLEIKRSEVTYALDRIA